MFFLFVGANDKNAKIIEILDDNADNTPATVGDSGTGKAINLTQEFVDQ